MLNSGFMMSTTNQINPPKISVITVCFNASEYIGATVSSIVEQKSISFEYLIQDGGSGDDTLNIAGALLRDVPEGVEVSVVSEEDDGVYDAMNRAVERARGEYIIFMNAGDVFYSADALSKIGEILKVKSVDVLYGRHVIYSNDYESGEVAPRPIGCLWKRMVFSHQSMFAKRSLLAEYPFKVESLSSDHTQIYEMYSNGAVFYETELCICRYLDGGLSVQHYRRSILDRLLGVLKADGIFRFRSVQVVLYYILIFFAEPTIYEIRRRRKS